MTRAWLILADILVISLLIISLILFYLYPPEKEKSVALISKSTLDIFHPAILDLNATITLEELIRMRQEWSVEEYSIENKFITRTLDEGLEALGANVGDPIFIRIFKEESLLEVWIRSKAKYRHLKDYVICSYSGSLGPKLKEGDCQAPEGFYTVKKHQLNSNSKYHLAFNLGYPNEYDRAHERTGSFLMVHGNCVSIGCYAMTDEKIEEIYSLLETALEKGQKYVQVHAYPFRMTEENMSLFIDSEWYDFWVNLKEGYDFFEAENNPPHVKVEDRQYTLYEANE